MTDQLVNVVVWYDNESYMAKSTENEILPENVPAAARLLMDGLYLRLDDQVNAAGLRAHRRRMRANRRERAGRRAETPVVEEAGEPQ